MAVTEDIGPAMRANEDGKVFRDAKDKEISLLERIEENIAAGALEQASIMIEKLKDENLRKMALALLPNPYDRNQR